MFCIILGTRPEFIKLCPVIRELDKRRLNYFIVHTGQHYSFEMDALFFKELQLPEVKHRLPSPSVKDLTRVLKDEKPSCVILLGDTHSTLVGALAANKVNIPVVHLEAGIRSYDNIREELNRFVVDHIAHILLSPTDIAMENLLKEGLTTGIYSGNTIVDAVQQNLSLTTPRHSDYILATFHRPENVDNPNRLALILDAMNNLGKVVFPCHPRTRDNIIQFGLHTTFTRPVGYVDFLSLQANAKLILTDSGGIQEEACILKVPCVTVRDKTERPESVIVGANKLCAPEDIEEAVASMIDIPRNWDNPYGDGHAAERIVDCLESAF